MLFLLRYGHGSCLLSDGSIIVVSGYGESSRLGSAPHSRLNDALRLHLDKNEWELCDLYAQGICPGVNLYIYIYIYIYIYTYKERQYFGMYLYMYLHVVTSVRSATDAYEHKTNKSSCIML